jgi:protein-disulfide isomerase
MEISSKSEKFATPAALLIGAVLIGGAILWSNAHPTVTKTTSAPQAPSTAIAVDARKVKSVGEPYIGNANAPITIAYWFDYQCPFCKQNEESVMPDVVKNYVDSGKVKIVFKDFEFLGADSQSIGQFARAVWAVAPDKFYVWHKAIFQNQGRENTGWATQAKIVAISKTVLGDSLTTKALQDVMANATTYQKEMDADKAEGSSLGVQGTPAFIIGKQFVSGAQPYAQIEAAITAAK